MSVLLAHRGVECLEPWIIWPWWDKWRAMYELSFEQHLSTFTLHILLLATVFRFVPRVRVLRVGSYKPVPKLQEAFPSFRHFRFPPEYYSRNLFGTVYGIKDKRPMLNPCLFVRALLSVIVYGWLICLIFVNFYIGVKGKMIPLQARCGTVGR